MNLKTIKESYYNGQKKQYIKQVKRYGVKKFHVDLSLETDYSNHSELIEFYRLIRFYNEQSK